MQCFHVSVSSWFVYLVEAHAIIRLLVPIYQRAYEESEYIIYPPYMRTRRVSKEGPYPWEGTCKVYMKIFLKYLNVRIRDCMSL
jgi:hypothetical protein